MQSYPYLTIIVGSVTVLLGVVVLFKITGLRSLAKMNTIDFASTIAIGSIIASSILGGSSILEGLLAIACILLVQTLHVQIGRKRPAYDNATQNTPTLLVKDGVFIQEALHTCNISKESIYAKLRLSNVASLSEVNAIVFETAGEISVIHGKKAIDDQLLANVK